MLKKCLKLVDPNETAVIGKRRKEYTKGIRKDRMWRVWVNQVGQT